jgi:hypothetical protein
MQLSDTSPEIEAMQIAIIRSKTEEQRLLLALDISLLCRQFMIAGIRNNQPAWSDKEVETEARRLSFFPDPVPAWIR